MSARAIKGIGRCSIAVDSTSDSLLFQLQGELTRAEIELTGAIESLDVIKSRFDSREVLDTSDGVVTAFQIRDERLNRPVTRGQRLLSIVEPAGPWQLELQIEEFRAGPVLQGFHSSQKPLDVEYLLATDVSQTHSGTLVTMAKRADERRQADRLIVNAIASVAPDEADRFVGAEVFAKIHCGKRRLGYVLFGDIIDFLRRNIWF